VIKNIQFSGDGWENYQEWFKAGDRKALKKINDLLDDIKKNGLSDGTGKPEKLRYQENTYSREINKGDRLIYTQEGDCLIILSCRGHYDDK